MSTALWNVCISRDSHLRNSSSSSESIASVKSTIRAVVLLLLRFAVFVCIVTTCQIGAGIKCPSGAQNVNNGFDLHMLSHSRPPKSHSKQSIWHNTNTNTHTQTHARTLDKWSPLCNWITPCRQGKRGNLSQLSVTRKFPLFWQSRSSSYYSYTPDANHLRRNHTRTHRFCLFLFTTDIGLKLTLNKTNQPQSAGDQLLQVCPILTHIVFVYIFAALTTRVKHSSVYTTDWLQRWTAY